MFRFGAASDLGGAYSYARLFSLDSPLLVRTESYLLDDCAHITQISNEWGLGTVSPIRAGR